MACARIGKKKASLLKCYDSSIFAWQQHYSMFFKDQSQFTCRIKHHIVIWMDIGRISDCVSCEFIDNCHIKLDMLDASDQKQF
jgi:hypothetical protein